MGNAQSLTRTGGALDSFVAELGSDTVFDKRCMQSPLSYKDLSDKDSLGSARFLKTVKCAHRNGFVVVKIFIKPDPGLSLRNHTKRLKCESCPRALLPS
jgi:phosphoinositide-3-kinase regulatory subunit 4